MNANLLFSKLGFISKVTLAVMLLSFVPKQNDESYLITEKWSQSLKSAQASGKAIFLATYTDWCAKCKLMNTRVLNDAEVKKLLTSKFHSVKMDMEDPENGDAANVKSKYNITAYPTYLVIGSNGNLISSKNNAESKEDLMKWLKGL